MSEKSAYYLSAASRTQEVQIRLSKLNTKFRSPASARLVTRADLDKLGRAPTTLHSLLDLLRRAQHNEWRAVQIQLDEHLGEYEALMCRSVGYTSDGSIGSALTDS